MGERGKDRPASEDEVEYFRHFESVHSPKITWQQMLEQKKVIGPDALLKTLNDARNFLITEPGPNLDRRKELTPAWFNAWERLIKKNSKNADRNSLLIDAGQSLCFFHSLQAHLRQGPEEGYIRSTSGMLFLAGGEGHEGHRHAAEYMASKVDRVVWGFEQESYMERKARGGSFLYLPVRLSMWHYHPNVHVLTVLPERPAEIDENQHYDSLFEQSGADYYFVDEADPHLKLKIRRGKKGVGTVIPHIDVARTTERVEKLLHEPTWEEIVADWGKLRLPSMSTSELTP